jgi:hypothetical protein
MSCWEFGASRQKTCSRRSASPSIPASCRHIYRWLPPQGAQCTMDALETLLEEYRCDHGRPALRHRRIPEEYEIPNPGKAETPEAEDAPEEEEMPGREDDTTPSARQQRNFRY